MSPRACEVPGCESQHLARGLCQRHYAAAWRERNPERSRENARRSYATSGRAAQYQRLYGVTEADLAAMHSAQGGACAICGTTAAESTRGLHLDHDHRTGQIRGLLCQPCNTALGKFRDSRALLATAIAYLDRADAARDA